MYCVRKHNVTYIFLYSFHQIVVVLRETEIPTPLTDLPVISVEKHGWWTQLLARLALPGDSHLHNSLQMHKH